MECTFKDGDGKCHGPYSGFGCIEEKCQADKGVGCAYNDRGFYCRKYRRFECIGQANCATLDDYMEFLRKRRDRTHISR